TPLRSSCPQVLQLMLSKKPTVQPSMEQALMWPCSSRRLARLVSQPHLPAQSEAEARFRPPAPPSQINQGWPTALQVVGKNVGIFGTLCVKMENVDLHFAEEIMTLMHFSS